MRTAAKRGSSHLCNLCNLWFLKQPTKQLNAYETPSPPPFSDDEGVVVTPLHRRHLLPHYCEVVCAEHAAEDAWELGVVAEGIAVLDWEASRCA